MGLIQVRFYYAKQDTTCSKCKKQITKGETIDFDQYKKPIHFRCRSKRKPSKKKHRVMDFVPGEQRC